MDVGYEFRRDCILAFLTSLSRIHVLSVCRNIEVPGKPVACNSGRLSVNCGLLWSIVTCYFWLLGVPGSPMSTPLLGSGSVSGWEALWELDLASNLITAVPPGALRENPEAARTRSRTKPRSPGFSPPPESLGGFMKIHVLPVLLFAC